MKLSVADRSIDRIGVTSEASFSVKATGKAFRILSSGLYRDKILAIVRELSCNAYDAHVAAKKRDTPFKVHLPNRLEPFFSIRDFGIGLSHDDMMTLYSTYFESTKSDSNDYIGALGLGSKSPFSYVDAFTVVSYFEGTKSSYACFINEYDCPVVTRMSSEPTKACNGLEVTIPVEKAADFDVFNARAVQVYEMFSPLPTIEGAPNFAIEATETVLERSGRWRINKTHPGRNPHPRAIMGKIAYPINLHSLQGASAGARRLLENISIDIDFDLGELEFTAGREELSYDQKVTMPNLLRRLDIVVKEIETDLSTRLATCQTKINAHRVYGEMKTSGVLGAIVDTLRWNGQDIASDYMEIDVKANDLTAAIYCVRARSTYAITASFRRVDELLSFSCMSLPKVYFRDTTKRRGARSRVAEAFRKEKQNLAFLIEGTPAEIDAVRALLDGIEFIDYETLPPPPKVEKRPVRFKVINDGRMSSYLPEADVDLDDGGFYLITHNGKIKNGTSTEAFIARYNALVANARIPAGTKVYAIPTSVSAKVVEHDDWQEITEWMKEEATSLLASTSTQKKLVQVKSYRKLQSTIGDYAINDLAKKWLFVAKDLSPDHILSRFVASLKAIQAATGKASPISMLVDSFATLITVDDAALATDNGLADLYDAVQATYPLFQYIPFRAFDAHYKEGMEGIALNYIKTVDGYSEHILSGQPRT